MKNYVKFFALALNLASMNAYSVDCPKLNPEDILPGQTTITINQTKWQLHALQDNTRDQKIVMISDPVNVETRRCRLGHCCFYNVTIHRHEILKNIPVWVNRSVHSRG